MRRWTQTHCERSSKQPPQEQRCRGGLCWECWTMQVRGTERAKPEEEGRWDRLGRVPVWMACGEAVKKLLILVTMVTVVTDVTSQAHGC